MSQLKIERAKLESDIKMKEVFFSFQYSNFKESMKIGNLISSFMTQFSLLVPLILRATQTFKTFYIFIKSQFKCGNQEENYSQEENSAKESYAKESYDSQEKEAPQES